MFDVAEPESAGSRSQPRAVSEPARLARVHSEDPALRRQMTELLSACGFTVWGGDDAELVVLVHAPPRQDVLNLCARMAARPGPAILFVDETNDPVDRILAIEMGCDDYISWPCPPREFTARVKALRRRRMRVIGSCAEDVNCDYVYDQDRREIFAADGRSVRLTSTDDRIFRALLAAEGRPLSDAELQAVAYEGLELASRTAALSAWRLQKKLRAVSEDEIVTVVRGRGHALAAPVALRGVSRPIERNAQGHR